MLVLKDLCIVRGTLTVANHLNLTFEQGKVYGILGANGAGKSSLIKAIFGALPYKGQIAFDGQIQAHSLRTWHKHIGYMPQDSSSDAILTALEVVLLGKMDSLHGHISDEFLGFAIRLLEELHISHLAHQPISLLSGGQRQLVMFAQALFKEPKILLLDEPVSALDLAHQMNLLEKVSAYTKQQGLITLTVLHDLSLAAQFCDEVILLNAGKIKAQGVPKEVLTAPTLKELYHIDVEILQCSQGLPVIRPKRIELNLV